jgi:hypothetical protein
MVPPLVVKVAPSSFTSSALLVTWKVLVAALTGRVALQPNKTPRRINMDRNFLMVQGSFQGRSRIVNIDIPGGMVYQDQARPIYSREKGEIKLQIKRGERLHAQGSTGI